MDRKTSLKRAAWTLVMAATGLAAASPAIGFHSKIGGSFPPCEKLVENLTLAASTPNPNAWSLLGEMYESGECLPMDKTKAAEYLDRAAEAGHEPAYPFLGYMYANGLGVERDPDEARYWFKKYVLSVMWKSKEGRLEGITTILHDRKSPPLLEEELRWIESVLAAAPREQVNIAIRLRDGDGLPLDRKAAYALLRKAIAEGIPEAKYELGRGFLARDYVYGRSFRHQEVRVAISYLEQAARARYAPAEKALGLFYAQPGVKNFNPEWSYFYLLRAKEDDAEGIDNVLARIESMLSDKERKRGRKIAKDRDRTFP